ncbi:hypothetical protein REPUB_Repub02eG0090100 [Reevesia pubescens]
MGFSKEDGLISKTKSMVLSLCSMISGSSRFPSPMQIQKDQCTASAYKQCLQLPGLKTLIYAQESETPQGQSPTHQLNPLIILPYTIPQSSSLSSSSDFQSLFPSLSTHSSSYSSCSSGMDDMLGTESGVYMSPDALKMPEIDQKTNGCSYPGKRKRERATMTGEYPPPIPLLARTGNLPGHMPWILARHYSNGRLILKEEKVKHHEYFEAYRENGRLILNLVPLDDTFRCCHSVCEESDNDEWEIELEDLEFFRGDQELEKVEEYYEETEADAEDNDYVNKRSIRISSTFSVPKFYHGNERYGDPRKCLTYSGRIISESNSIFCNIAGDDQEEGNSAPLTFCNIIPPMTTTSLQTACDVACLVK